MKHLVSPLSFVLLIALCTTLNAGEMRRWTGSNGKVIEAEFLGLEGDIVRIKVKTGREMNVLLSNFAEKDQAYIRNQGSIENGFEQTKTLGDQPGEQNELRDVLRITLAIDILGKVKIELENTNTSPIDTFEGRAVQTILAPKSSIAVKEKLTRFCFDFKDPDRVMDIFVNESEGVLLDKENALLLFDRPKRGTATYLTWPRSYKLALPMKIQCDVALFSRECLNLEWTFNESDESASIILFRITSSKEGKRFHVNCSQALPRKRKEAWNFQRVYEKKDISLDRPFDTAFDIRLPHYERLRFSIGKNIRLKNNETPDLNPLGIARMEISGRIRPVSGVNTKEENGKYWVTTLTRMGLNSGIPVGSEIIKINGRVPKQYEDVLWPLSPNFSFEKGLSVEYRKDGITNEVVLVDAP